MGEPKEFSCSSGKDTILRFIARTRDSGLLFSTSRNHIISKINRVARGRTASIGTTDPISVGVSNYGTRSNRRAKSKDKISLVANSELSLQAKLSRREELLPVMIISSTYKRR